MANLGCHVAFLCSHLAAWARRRCMCCRASTSLRSCPFPSFLLSARQFTLLCGQHCRQAARAGVAGGQGRDACAAGAAASGDGHLNAARQHPSRSAPRCRTHRHAPDRAGAVSSRHLTVDAFTRKCYLSDFGICGEMSHLRLEATRARPCPRPCGCHIEHHLISFGGVFYGLRAVKGEIQGSEVLGSEYWR